MSGWCWGNGLKRALGKATRLVVATHRQNQQSEGHIYWEEQTEFPVTKAENK